LPIMFITGLVFLALAFVAMLVWFKARNNSGYDDMPPGVPMTATLGLAIVGGLIIALASMSSVPIRNVGIVTSWNKPTGATTGAGFQITAPWENIEDWDASRQAYDHRGDRACVNVRIATLSNACVETLIEWQVHESKAPEQWASYKKDFNLFIGRRIDPAMQDAMNAAFAGYDPLANIDAATGNLNVPTGPLAEAVRVALEAKIGEDVKILTVAIPRVNHDEKTQASIDAYQQAINRSRVLDQEKANAEKQKAITETNAKVDPITRCLELADKHAKEPGFCFGTANPVQQR
jgi:regulator of protease activity HflC (stomatin/prohibitin superfamily)